MPQSPSSASPTPQEWSALYQAAIEFRDLAPWQWMWDTDLFGVQEPRTGEVGYCCIMGRLGEHFAMAVYEGSEGLAGLWQMRQVSNASNPVDILMLQKCLMASFEDRRQLQQQDLSQIQSLGLKFRGRHAWPQFRSYLPGYQPWFLTAPQTRFLTLALQQSLDVARRFQTDPDLLPQASPKGAYLVRVQQPDGSWRDTFAKPAQAVAERPSALPLDDITAARADRLKRLPKTRGTLEMEFFYMPGAVKGENGGRPYFPYVVMAADTASGMILGINVVSTEEIAPAMVGALLDVIEQVNMLPAEVLVGREEARVWLQPLVRELGIRVVRVRQLPAIEAARSELSNYMGFEPPDM